MNHHGVGRSAFRPRRSAGGPGAVGALRAVRPVLTGRDCEGSHPLTQGRRQLLRAGQPQVESGMGTLSGRAVGRSQARPDAAPVPSRREARFGGQTEGPRWSPPLVAPLLDLKISLFVASTPSSAAPFGSWHGACFCQVAEAAEVGSLRGDAGKRITRIRASPQTKTRAFSPRRPGTGSCPVDTEKESRCQT